MKTTSPLASLFGKSPFRPMQEHMRIVERCVLELPPAFEALRRNDMDEVRARRDAVSALEHEADELKNRIRSGLPATFLMPVGRSDLLDLLTTQDAIAGAAQDAVNTAGLGKLRVPSAMDGQIMPFVERVVEAVTRCRTAIDTLDELVETGFRGREANAVLEIVVEIDAIESDTDRRGMELVRTLVDQEAELGAVAIMFWYHLIRSLGTIADEAENVGDRLRLLLAR